MKKYKISVITPAYNSEKTIRKAIKTIKRQGEGIQHIIIDDASDDHTREIIEKYAENNVLLIDNKKNLGSGPSRNKGIASAEGKYIFFLDSDDILPNKNSLQTMYDICERKQIPICGSLRELKYRIKVTKEEMYREECKNTNGLIFYYKDTQVDYHFTNYLFNKELLIKNDIKFPNLRRYQDVPFLVNAMIHAEKYYVAPIEGYRYSLRIKPLTYNEQMIEDLLKGMNMVLKMAEENNLEKLKQRTIMRLEKQFTAQLSQAINSSNEKISIELGSLIVNYGLSIPKSEAEKMIFIEKYKNSVE